MPTQSGPVEAGAEAARKLLEGVDPQSLPRAELLAAIEVLAGHKSESAADILAGLEEPKDVAKAARSALFKLQSQGIRPRRPADRKAPLPAPAQPPAARIKLIEGRVSSYDPRGTRAVSILAEKAFTGLVNLFAIASDSEGLLDVELSSTTKKAYFTRLENFTRQYGYIEFVDVPADYANQMVHRCAALNEKSGALLPQDFSMWKSFGAEAPEPALEPVVLGELDVEDVRRRVALEDTKDLAHTEFEAWGYDQEQLKEHLTRLDTARGGPLVLSSDAQQRREKAILDEATDDIFKGDELQRAKDRLLETAHFLLRQGQREPAEKCLRAGLEVDTRPAHEQPFLREVVSKSFDLAQHGDHDHDHEHEHTHEHEPPVTRTESGLVLPA